MRRRIRIRISAIIRARTHISRSMHASEVEGKTGKSCSVFVSCVTCVRSCARVIPCAWPLRRTRVLLLLLGWAPVVSRGVSWCLVSHGVSWCLVSHGVSCLMVSRGPRWCLVVSQPPSTSLSPAGWSYRYVYISCTVFDIICAHGNTCRNLC